jgi:formate dehydrogenase iron-sulfur subunit
MSAAIRIFVPVDAAALSVGAEAVAQAIAREAQAHGTAVEIIRNGSRGMLWLEPMVEVETPEGRIALWPGRRSRRRCPVRSQLSQGRCACVAARPC